MTIYFWSRFVLVTTVWCALSASVSQAPLLQGTIDGNVKDPTQAAVVGATTNATNTETNFSRETVHKLFRRLHTPHAPSRYLHN